MEEINSGIVHKRLLDELIELKNSMFIHVLKCGGRTVKQMLKKYVSGCKVLGDDIYESHATPDTDKKVFGFVRHPNNIYS